MKLGGVRSLREMLLCAAERPVDAIQLEHAGMTSRRVLITGGKGQLGNELSRATWPYDWQPIALGRDALNLADPEAITAVIAEGSDGQPWAAVINAGAYTAVDKAEDEPIDAWTVNALAPAAIGAACRDAAIPLIQISTDYVFSGEQTSAWEVYDTPSPLSVYGASKLGGELAVQTSGARYAIIRTAWTMSAHGSNFVKTMLRLGAGRDVVRVVGDQRGSPTSAGDLAAATVALTVRLATDSTSPVGIFHFANAGDTNWAAFATEIFRQSGLRGGPTAMVESITTADYPTAARRPANSLLSTTAIAHTYGIESRPWRDALGDILDELIGKQI